MIIGVPKETKFKENRVAITPLIAKDLIKQGFTVMVEQGAGINSFFSDDEYISSGASIIPTKELLYEGVDVVLKVNAPLAEEIALMKKEAILISFMWAATNPELVNACEKAGVSAFSMDAVPRISRAQKMDALSS
ncbi:MAG: NAD(P)(+) transhydrogenase (Re/Si-specific) subunit alpha, partial [Chitinophagales bacterium]|nr:NAD(P)(+) transhydrogenase (Re/Si-specific) subunit alpha [Chitinophagales bacterium]